jgi:tight adherence protein B
VSSAFTSAAKTLASQLTFSLPLPIGVSAVQTVVVSGESNGRPFSSSALVDFGAVVSAPTKPSAPSTQAIAGPRDDTVKASGPEAKLVGVPVPLALGMGAVFLGLVGLALGFSGSTFRSGRQTRVENIERYVAPGASLHAKAKSTNPSAVSESLVFIGEKVKEGRESTGKTMARIVRADLPLRAGEWWVLRIVAIFAGAAVVAVLFHGGVIMTVVAVVLGAVVGWFLPTFVLRFLANRRGKKFDAQLPDVLTLVASSLSTGFSLPQALDAVAKDTADPAAKEFSRALAETRIGADVADSLEHMATRMESENMRWTAMAIRIQREVGGNLAETLRTTAKTLREREELRRHVRALSAEGRLSAYILIALPIGIFLYTMQTNRSYIELLWTTTLGIAMIVAGVVSLGIGVFWMRKVVDVNV